MTQQRRNEREPEKKSGKGGMSVEEAGRLGGEKGGQKGGQRVRELIEEGKRAEADQGKRGDGGEAGKSRSRH